MSLDVYLMEDGAPSCTGSGIYVREAGSTRELSREEWDAKHPGQEPVTAYAEDGPLDVFWRNITHNLTRMADETGIYKHLWRPEEIGITQAKQLIRPLTVGLALLRSDERRFAAFSAPNGWGTYDDLCKFVAAYLNACEEHPNATIRVSR